ncbi:MAG: hypothetical protein ACTSQ8_22825 [Candidatus Helarchaeota archaeon]
MEFITIANKDKFIPYKEIDFEKIKPKKIRANMLAEKKINGVFDKIIGG